jgi:uncharacterized Zn finger protein
MGWYFFRPYVSAAKRRANAAQEVAKLAKKGQVLSPIKLAGRKIASTFWGKAWCDNLESYSDFANRLPRGRSYVRNGSVVDLQIESGNVTALVSGSKLYKIRINITPLPAKTWESIRRECAGKIGSLVELLQGKLSDSVMQIVTRRSSGLFPAPAEIKLDCSCPDYADMCKHVAAALYAVGSRLDEKPELLFTLRQVDHLELVAQAGDVGNLTKGPSDAATIAADLLGDVFGIELDNGAAAPPATPPSPTTAVNKKTKPAARITPKSAKPAEKTSDVPATIKRRPPARAGSNTSAAKSALDAGVHRQRSRKRPGDQLAKPGVRAAGKRSGDADKRMPRGGAERAKVRRRGQG